VREWQVQFLHSHPRTWWDMFKVDVLKMKDPNRSRIVNWLARKGWLEMPVFRTAGETRTVKLEVGWRFPEARIKHEGLGQGVKFMRWSP
jgi:hypothetical protein